jgi:hypothetical protein
MEELNNPPLGLSVLVAGHVEGDATADGPARADAVDGLLGLALS